MELFATKVACPKCGTQVKAQAKFCFSCGEPMAGENAVAGNRWKRGDDDFAVRIESPALSGVWMGAAKPLTIEHGTRALIFQAGVFKGEVSEGRYDMGGFVQKLNHFMVDQGMVAILVDAGDVALELDNKDLLTRDGFAVGAKTRVVLQIADPDRMFLNLMKGTERVSVSDLADALRGELTMVLGSLIAARPAEELLTSATVMVRSEIESALQRTLAVTLERLGLSLVQVRFIDFSGEKYRDILRQRGETNAATMARRDKLADSTARVDIEADRVKLAGRLREVLNDDKLGKLKFDEVVRQAEHDLGLKQVVRDDEMARLAERFSFERGREGVVRRIEVEGIQNDHTREQAWKELEARERHADEAHRHDLQRQLAGARGELDQRKIRVDLERLDHAERLRQDEEKARSEVVIRKTRIEAERAENEEKVRKTQIGIDHLKQLKALEADEEERQLKSRSGADVAALLSVVGDGQAQRILELEKLRARKGLTAEEMLAMAADASPEAAAALRARYSQDAAKERLEVQQRTSDAHTDRMADVMKTAMNQMGNVATAKADSSGTKPTIVTGSGQPTVITAPNASSATCKFCGAILGPAKTFCGECGKQQ